MRGARTCLAATFAAFLASTDGGPAEAGAFRPPAQSGPAFDSLREPPPPRAEMDFAYGVGADTEALFRLPEAAEPSVEGPFSRYAERRGARASLVPWDLGQGDDRFAANATFFPLLGGALLLAWLTLSGWQPTLRRPRRRRRGRRSARAGAAARSTPSAAR